MNSENYVKRRFGIISDFDQREVGTIPLTENITEMLPLIRFKQIHEKPWFITICNICLLVYFSHILVHIEFKNELTDGLVYFFIIEGFCLLIFVIRISLALTSQKLKYMNFSHFIDLVGVLIGVIVFVLEIADPYFMERLIFKIGSILRFLILFALIKIVNPQQESSSKFSVTPCKTRPERLVGILRQLREIEVIKNNPYIDSQLEWGIKTISNHTLYTVDVFTENKEQEDVIKWAMTSISKPKQSNKAKSISIHDIQNFHFESQVNKCLAAVDKFSFNIFELKTESNDCELSVLTSYLLASYDLFNTEKINEEKFKKYIELIQEGYNSSLPYHNSTHAADVVQAIHYFIKTCKAREFANLSSSDICICLISAAIHDFQHPGLNNAFLINTSDPLAILYNDKSVLENHHVSASFKLLAQTENNFWEEISVESMRKYRAQIISLVLSTDFSKHFKELGKFKLTFHKDSQVKSNKPMVMKMIMHAADVSNSMRGWEIYYKWAQRVIEEFFCQGDKEKELGIGISPLCDRNNVNFAKCQIGFIDMFIEPIVKSLKEVMPKFEKCEKNLLKNRQLLSEMNNEEKSK